MLKSMLLLLVLPCLFANIADFDEKWLENVVRNYYSKEGRQIKKIDSVTLSPADPPGTVYGSNRTRAIVQMTLGSGEVRKDSYLVVALPSHPLREKQLTEAELFLTDIKVYQEVLPKMNSFLKAYNDDEKVWVEPLLLEEYKRLVLEDPEGLQYHLKNRRDGVDEEHIKVAVGNMAKFHALSAVLKSKNQITIDPFNLALIQKNKGKSDWYGTLFKDFAKSIRSYWGAEWEKTAVAFENRALTVQNDLQKIFERDNSKFNSLVNGAFYINNLYFKYQQDGKTPIGMKMVNFQNAFWNSPAMDLQLLFNTSPEPEIIADDAKREEFVNHYTEQLATYLKKYGYDRPVTKEEIKSEIQRTEFLGLAYAINYLSGMYTAPEDSTYSEEFIIDALKNQTKTPKIDSHGMAQPKFITVMKKLVQRAQKLAVINA